MGDIHFQLSNQAEPGSPTDASRNEGFDQVLALHAAAVRLYVRSLMPGYAGADDIAQDVLLKVWEKRNEYAAGSNFKAWAFQVARYLVMNQRRKLARTNLVPLDEELLNQIDQRWLQHDTMGSQEEFDALQKCIGLLNPNDRELLHTRYATDISVETFAEQEGTRPGTLKARLFRLRESLRRCMALRLLES